MKRFFLDYIKKLQKFMNVKIITFGKITIFKKLTLSKMIQFENSIIISHLLLICKYS